MRVTYNGRMHISSKQLSPAGLETGAVFWGPAWVDGVLGRLVLMSDKTTLAERWGTDGWSPDELPSIPDLLRWGVPATEDTLKDLGVASDPFGLASHTAPPVDASCCPG